jgi:hypothetical protein
MPFRTAEALLLPRPGASSPHGKSNPLGVDVGVALRLGDQQGPARIFAADVTARVLAARSIDPAPV